MAIPIIGYAIILGDQTNGFFSLDDALGENKEYLILSTSSRSKLLYAGLIIILIACILFYCGLPKAIKLSSNKFSYIENGMKNFASHDFVFVMKKLRRKYREKLEPSHVEFIENLEKYNYAEMPKILSNTEQSQSYAKWEPKLISILSVYFTMKKSLIDLF